MENPMIACKGLTKIYRRGGEKLVVLDHLDLQMEAGRFYALMGPSGSGKTTLLNLIGGLDRPDDGDVVVAGSNLANLTSGELAQWRATTVGFIFQGFNLIPVLSALENVLLPLTLTPLSRTERKEHARLALEVVGMSDRMDHRPAQLSGGQEQRVAIARAIATDPKILLCDEPTGDLDRDSADQVMDLLVRLGSEFGKTILMVSHDPAAAGRAEQIVNLDKGRLGSIEAPTKV
ncbi:MAG: putative ABC transport system ATP-binding protein [Planctomycetota bacterium]|jgi:putative ABC transport system ATP-binding protein